MELLTMVIVIGILVVGIYVFIQILKKGESQVEKSYVSNQQRKIYSDTKIGMVPSRKSGKSSSQSKNSRTPFKEKHSVIQLQILKKRGAKFYRKGGAKYIVWPGEEGYYDSSTDLIDDLLSLHMILLFACLDHSSYYDNPNFWNETTSLSEYNQIAEIPDVEVVNEDVSESSTDPSDIFQHSEIGVSETVIESPTQIYEPPSYDSGSSYDSGGGDSGGGDSGGGGGD